MLHRNKNRDYFYSYIPLIFIEYSHGMYCTRLCKKSKVNKIVFLVLKEVTCSKDDSSKLEADCLSK